MRAGAAVVFAVPMRKGKGTAVARQAVMHPTCLHHPCNEYQYEYQLAHANPVVRQCGGLLRPTNETEAAETHAVSLALSHSPPFLCNRKASQEISTKMENLVKVQYQCAYQSIWC